MVLVSDRADAADDWIAERISAVDVCVTSDIPLAAGCLEMGARRFPNRQTLDTSEYRQCACRSGDSQAPAGAGREYPWASPADKEGPVPVSQRARHGRPSCSTSCGAQLSQFRQHCRRRPTSRRRLVVGHAQFAVARMPALSASLRQGSGLNLHDRMRRSSWGNKCRSEGPPRRQYRLGNALVPAVRSGRRLEPSATARTPRRTTLERLREAPNLGCASSS